LVTTGKADLNLQNEYGNTPLHIVAAEVYFDQDFYDFLIGLGAKDDIVNHAQQTPKDMINMKEYKFNC
jgi:ankyrin repeat protein